MPVTTDGSGEDIWSGRQVIDKWLEGNQNSYFPSYDCKWENDVLHRGMSKYA